MTILSVNKTREQMGALRPSFVVKVTFMNGKAKKMTHGALIGALYVGVSYLQNLLLPGSATWAIQFRIAEALCVLALFHKAAIPGLSVGCLLFNLTVSAALPLDFLVGSLATLVSTKAMWLLRNIKIAGLPIPALLMPAICNGVLVGWELSVTAGGGFLLNALYVAVGEAAVLLSLGSFLYLSIRRRNLSGTLFG